jgi:uncharacterized membrane protein YbhN (UPF0104 family)
VTSTDPTDDEAAASTPPTRFARLIATAVALRERVTGAGRRSPALERAMLGAAMLLFVGATVLAARNLPNVHAEPNYFLLVLVGVLGVPAATLVNATEYVAAGQALGHRVGLLHAARVSTVATAANLLPIPGAVMVRARALRVLGSNYRKSLAVLGGIGVIWLATTGVLAAAALVIAGYNVAIGLAFGLGGVLAGAGGFALVRISVGRDDAMKWFVRFVLIEIASVGVFAVRFTLVLEGFGFHASWSQTLTLTIATAAASAVGILPAGLGVRELLAAALAPLVNLKPAVALFAVSVDRVIGLVVLAIMSGVLVFISHGREITGDDEDDDIATDDNPEELEI